MRLAVPSTPSSEAAVTKQTLREVDRRTATATTNISALSATARHHWTGSVSAPPNASTVFLTSVDGTYTVDEGVATFIGGELTLNQAGRWSLWIEYASDSTTNGNSRLWLGSADRELAPWGPFHSELRDERIRGSGFGQAGSLCQVISWSGLVTEAQAASPIVPGLFWRSPNWAAPPPDEPYATGFWSLGAHLLGASIAEGT